MRVPALRLRDPADVRLRAWVLIPLGPQARRAYGITDKPAGICAADDLPTLHRMVRLRLTHRQAVVTRVIGRLRLGEELAGRDPLAPIPLSRVVELVERLTITEGGRGPVRRKGARVRLGALEVRPRPGATPDERSAWYYVARAARDAFSHGLVEWCFRPLDLGERELAEYEGVLAALRGITRPGEHGARALARTVGGAVAVTLAGRRYGLPAGWQQRLARETSPSECAAFLLSVKWRTNTRAVQERVTRARREQDIAHCWAGYRRFLTERPGAREELADLLGGLLTMPDLTEAKTTTPR